MEAQVEVSVCGFKAFFSPVDNPPFVNQIKAGQGVPVKFSLAGDFGLDIFESTDPKFESTPCDAGDKET